MSRPSEDDRAAIDRAFAEMVASYHLTADRPEPVVDRLPVEPPAEPSAPSGPTRLPAESGWRAEHLLFRYSEPAPTAPRAADREEAPDEPYVPEPLPPMRRPGVPALLGWVGIGYAVLVVLAATFGVRLPAWAGWLAVGTFLTGFAILLTRLPRHRSPDAGDGAVL